MVLPPHKVVIDIMARISTLTHMRPLYLDISKSAVVEISPIGELISLTSLHLDIQDTAVYDITAIVNMSSLTCLSCYLRMTKVTDLQPIELLVGLTSLHIDIRYTSIVDTVIVSKLIGVIYPIINNAEPTDESIVLIDDILKNWDDIHYNWNPWIIRRTHIRRMLKKRKVFVLLHGFEKWVNSIGLSNVVVKYVKTFVRMFELTSASSDYITPQAFVNSLANDDIITKIRSKLYIFYFVSRYLWKSFRLLLEFVAAQSVDMGWDRSF